ncbi:MAG TPA: 2-oxoglutarate dehydrogenase E1 component [Pirellulales bacterium]|jgi:2-oxoglutarate dehydrogenase E1 component|nr:2-oxoglutarate dehydrogenase E1 component [Pirellulales bacterium]
MTIELETQVGSLSLEFVEGLLSDYLRDPDSIPPDWRAYFDNIIRNQSRASVAAASADGDKSIATGQRNGNEGNGNVGELALKQIGPSFRPSSMFSRPGNVRAASHTSVSSIQSADSTSPASPPQTPHLPARSSSTPSQVTPQSGDQLGMAVLQDRVDQLIRAYRVRGHLVARLDPLGFPRPELPELDPEFYGFTSSDMDREFSTATIEGPQSMTLGRIIQRLKNTYCRSIGVQFMHMDDLPVRQWLQERMEGSENHCTLSRKEQLRILHGLTSATVFEEFIQRRFLGAKSFSLEGAETLIPLLDLTVERAGEHKVEEIVLAMAHRGRLNVLANVIGKSAQQIFREFADIDPELHIGRGDVKYHLGHSADIKTATGHRLHLSLCFNPSHLEFVNPVAMGRVRAKQDRVEDHDRRRGMLLLIHGDAAFAGEGIIQETLNLSQLEAYKIGGAMHVVLNNQIGFTTSPAEARSTTYATDVAKMLQIPIFHVNGEDPEAVAQVVRLAMDFRREFQRDVVIDMYCYRRRGHNEADEPQFTQPLLYQAIERRKNVREGYLDHLLKLGGIDREAADHIAAELRNQLEEELSAAKSEDFVPRPDLASFWAFYIGGREREAAEVETDMKREQLADLLGMLSHVPRGFNPHPKILRWLESRREMIDGRRPIDWSAAESLAIGSLAVQKLRVRISGQDTERGTFSHRHAVLHDIATGQHYMPLANLTFDQASVEIYNSPLSEAGVLGFEYGYSLDCPDGLVMWEAQFGDFVNAAQVIIDQFIVSAEDKWRRLSGIVLLLPHGFEGMGPEHSSARLERFLSLAAKDNIQVCNLTTPAQLFHCLRRQVLRVWRKPLVLMTPKSLLRHPQCISTLDELAQGKFLRVLPDVPPPERTVVERVLLCSGKIYYELEQKRRQSNKTNVAILRMEQLYPLPKEPLKAALANYRDGTPVFWIQEEPENMGAWRYLKVHLGERLFDRFPFSGIYRQSAASPATGSASSHKLEQEELLARALGE